MTVELNDNVMNRPMVVMFLFVRKLWLNVLQNVPAVSFMVSVYAAIIQAMCVACKIFWMKYVDHMTTLTV